MLVNLFFQTVIFLYLADNDTTYMVLGTNAVGLAIEVGNVCICMLSVTVLVVRYCRSCCCCCCCCWRAA